MAVALERRIPPPVVAACAAALMLGAAWVVPALTLELPWRVPAVIALAALGGSLDLAALAQFLRARTTINPLKPESASALVTAGPYRFTRNPMYLGLTVLLIAWAVYLASLAALGLVPLFVLYIDRFQIAPEERVLAARFGAVYEDYRSRVRRWL